MAHNFYIVPAELNTPPLGNRAPKYFNANDPNVTSNWNAYDYGSMPTFIVASPTTPTEDTYLRAQADVYAFDADSDNLNSEIGGATVVGLRNALEAVNLPGQWVSANNSYREMLRSTFGAFQFAQRVYGISGLPLVPTGTNLSTQWGFLPTENKTAIIAAMNSFGYNQDWTANTPFRNVIKSLADQWGAKPFFIGVQL